MKKAHLYTNLTSNLQACFLIILVVDVEDGISCMTLNVELRPFRRIFLICGIVVR